ncbi:uncharacterized protein LOC123331363 [Bubalus bubalis]|uniref:uncharacterized protein LOC123331363 n=1 Tax=Bubalus bubalis TaxID=89462 RepID=UPI001E1B7774|nr:uncharacterized protein LOC123331363 [Bubalus bubalis]
MLKTFREGHPPMDTDTELSPQWKGVPLTACFCGSWDRRFTGPGGSPVADRGAPEGSGRWPSTLLACPRGHGTCRLQLEQLNKDLNEVLHKVQQHCCELPPDQGLQPADQPTDMRRRCEEEAREIVRHANSSLLSCSRAEDQACWSRPSAVLSLAPLSSPAPLRLQFCPLWSGSPLQAGLKWHRGPGGEAALHAFVLKVASPPVASETGQQTAPLLPVAKEPMSKPSLERRVRPFPRPPGYLRAA